MMKREDIVDMVEEGLTEGVLQLIQKMSPSVQYQLYQDHKVDVDAHGDRDLEEQIGDPQVIIAQRLRLWMHELFLSQFQVPIGLKS